MDEDKKISEAFFFFTVEYISNFQKSLPGKRGLNGFFPLFLPFLADKTFTRKPPRFSCLLPDPRELIEIKNKKKVHTDVSRAQLLPTSVWVFFVGFLSQRMRDSLAAHCTTSPVSFEVLPLLQSHVVSHAYPGQLLFWEQVLLVVTRALIADIMWVPEDYWSGHLELWDDDWQ